MALLFAEFMNYSFGITPQVVEFADLSGILSKMLYGVAAASNTLSALLNIMFMCAVQVSLPKLGKKAIEKAKDFLLASACCIVFGIVFTTAFITYTNQIPMVLNYLGVALVSFILAIVFGKLVNKIRGKDI